MDIPAFISELLEHQEKLTVPGLGTFYRSRVEGYYSKEQQQFYPPSLQLQFNAEQHADDGLLVDAITADRHISPTSARFLIENYISELLTLVNMDSVSIGELGSFSMRRNQLVFTPKKLNNNNELFYGLAPVRLRRNKLQQTAGIPKPVLQMPVTEKPSAFTAALLRGEPMPGKPLTTSGGEEEVTATEEKKPAGISTWILVLALVILLTGLGLIFAYKYKPALFDRFRSQNEPPPITSDKKRERMISDSIQNAIEAQKSIGATPVIDSATKSKIIAPEAPRDTFGLVVGSFSHITGARKDSARYSYTHYPVEIHKNPHASANPFQLTVATYFNIDSASKYRAEYRKRLSLPELFIQEYPYKKQ